MRKKLLTVAFAALTLCTYAQNKAVTINDIKEMVSLGLDDELIIGQIESGNAQFDLSVNDILELKKEGATNDLISYLQKIAKVANQLQGVYWMNGDKNVKINYTNMTDKQKKSFGGLATGVGGALAGRAIGGTAGTVVGAVAGSATSVSTRSSIISGATSRNVINESSPVFYFYFPKVENNAFQTHSDAQAITDLFNNWWGTIQSPNEFALIKLKKGKSNRSMPDGMSLDLLGSASFNIPAGSNVDFEIEQINNYTFKVVTAEPLAPGEYCFYYKGSSEQFIQNQTAYDFSIQ